MRRPGTPGEQGESARGQGGEFGGWDDGVDDAFGDEVLGHLDAFGERLSVQYLVDGGPEEADQRARFGDGHMAERPPRTRRRRRPSVAQVDEIGEASCLMRHDGPADLHHLDERRGALLHAGAA
jgi:hypothetical protein